MDDRSKVKADPRRALPSVAVLASRVGELQPGLADWASAEGSRRVLGNARSRLTEDPAARPPGDNELVSLACRAAAELVRPWPRRVVNATGVVLHTNLGRAVLAAGAAEAAAGAASGYAALELDLASGERGDRMGAVCEKLVQLSGAEAALVVNNNAAAVLLALATLAHGREVVVSRGELVEIGGSFRVPEILEQAGVRLVEVGTTNRTHPADYRRAVGPETRVLLKVHRSNFEQRGFVAEVDLGELAAIAQEKDLALVEDLGSAALLPVPIAGIPAEALAASRLRQGADLVCFSGDKLLGGPQAGIVLGRAEIVAAMRRNPLARALRLDKLCLAALDWTLGALLGGRGPDELPVLRQLLLSPARLEARARELAARLGRAAGDALVVGVERDESLLGGGTLPGFALETWVVTLEGGGGARRLAAALRMAPVPVLVRIRDECVLIDVRTLLDGDAADVEAAVSTALPGASR